MFSLRSLIACLTCALLVACAPSPGDCPTPDDCACPCTDEQAPVCDQQGVTYLNLCMLECDGRTQGVCDNPEGQPQGKTTADCDAECADDGYEPVCGAVGRGNDKSHQTFDNACYRSCLGAQSAPDKKCE